MKSSERLGTAKHLVMRPGVWIKGSMWEDEEGRQCPFEEAVCFCTLGSLEAAGLAEHDSIENSDFIGVTIAAEYLRKAIGREAIGQWNDEDDRTLDEVIVAFDMAIELALAAGD